MPVIKNGDYVLVDKPTDRQVIAAQANTIKQLQGFIEDLPSWEYVNELKKRVAYLEVLCKLKGGKG